MLVECFWYSYLSYISAVILHELLHLVSALIFNIKINKIQIGNFIFLRIKKLFFSPIILSGSLYVDYDSLISKKKAVICCFYLSGICGNIILLVLSLLLIDNTLLMIWAIAVNGMSIAFSVLPIIDDNDAVMLFTLLQEKRKME